ncbi:DUF4352 domain-containing protein [Paenibacillus sp. AK121]|uniref:DUF4352 domain-containing protein n=1 Tax=Paenibacillus sp. AK121 TaxID=2849670 RepID=UPI001C23393B|nr:DUF4352 domain-containing protein [Paenibacillus sp. AK121]
MKDKIYGVIGAVVALFVILAVSGKLTSDNPEPLPASTNTGSSVVLADTPKATMPEDKSESVTPKSKGPVIGDKVKLGTYEFTATGISEKGSVGDITTEGKFVVVSVKVRNVGSKPVNIDSNYFTLYDSNGRKYDPSGDANSYLKEQFAFDSLNPGLSRKAQVAFEVPIDAVGFSLDARDNMFDTQYADKVTINLSK